MPSAKHEHPHDPPPSLDERRFVAQLLVASVDQIASDASTNLIERWPDIAHRYNPMAFDRWKENYAGRIADLASAIAAGSPQVFVDQIAWSRVAFESRGVPKDDLARSLDMLGESLERFIPEEDNGLVQQYLQSAGKSLYAGSITPPTNLSVHTPQGDLAARYLLAALEGERFTASHLVLEAVRTDKITVRDAYELVLLPVQREVGRLWHLNDLTVAEEHFVSATTQLTIGQLYPFLSRAPRNGKTVAAASVEGNAHDIGVRMVSDYFEMAGWRAIYLGANVPTADLAQAVDHFDADLICLSAYLPTQLRAAEDTIAAIRSTPRGATVKVLVGGPAFGRSTHTWNEIGADAYAADANQAVLIGAKLVGL
jgi:methanogenic corrinoid protein MtbC1